MRLIVKFTNGDFANIEDLVGIFDMGGIEYISQRKEKRKD